MPGKEDQMKLNAISSGETQVMISNTENGVYLFLNDTDGEYSWTLASFEKSPEELFNEFLKLKCIEPINYVVNYILAVLDMSDIMEDREKQLAFIAWIRSFVKEEICENQEFSSVWDTMVTKLNGMFEESGFAGSCDWKEVFRKVLDHFDYELLKFLALGLHSGVEELNLFFTKVMERAKINLRDRDELFLFLTQKYSKDGRYFENYKKLWNLYPEENTKEKYDAMSPEERKELTYKRTRLMNAHLDDILERFQNADMFEQKEEQLENYLDNLYFQNELLKEGKAYRTSYQIYLDLWDEICKEIAERPDIYVQEKPMRSLTVLYDAERGGVIPANTVFQKGDILCISPFEQVLPPQKWAELEIKVKALTKKEDILAWIDSQTELDKKARKQKVSFVKNLNQYLEKGAVLYTAEEAYADVISDIRAVGSVRYFENAKSNEGTLLVKCKLGTELKKGARFCFVQDEFRFEYECLEDVSYYPAEVMERCKIKDGTAIGTIDVVWDNHDSLWKKYEDKHEEDRKNAEKNGKKSSSKWDVEILPAGSVFEHSQKEECLVLSEKRFAVGQGNEKDKVPDTTLIRYLYGMDDHPELLKEKDYRGYPEYGSEFYLNSSDFISCMIRKKEDKTLLKDDKKLRNRIITLKFLEYCLLGDADAVREEDVMDIISDFKDQVDELLIECGFQPFLSSYVRYDAVIGYALTGDEPLPTYQKIWGLNWKKGEK